MSDVTTPNQFALAALRERRAELASQLTETQRRLRYLQDAIAHLDGELRLFNSDLDPASIPAKKPYKRVKLFGQGKLNRMILDVLRVAERPLATLEVVDLVVANAGFGPDAAAGMKGRVRANLLYLWKTRELVMKTGERATARWSLQAF